MDGGKQHVLFHGLHPTARHLACIEVLLKEGADINTRDQKGQTLLVQTVRMGYVDITETLIQLGADVKTRNEEGESLVYTAAKHDHMKLIPILVRAGAPINESGRFFLAFIKGSHCHIFYSVLVLNRLTDN